MRSARQCECASSQERCSCFFGGHPHFDAGGRFAFARSRFAGRTGNPGGEDAHGHPLDRCLKVVLVSGPAVLLHIADSGLKNDDDNDSDGKSARPFQGTLLQNGLTVVKWRTSICLRFSLDKCCVVS